MKKIIIIFFVFAAIIGLYKYQKEKENAKIEAVRNLSDEELEDLCVNKYNKAACSVRSVRFIKSGK